MRLINLVGKIFGRLMVISRSNNSGKHTMWLCRCNCGVETVVSSNNLRSGNTRSCGCYRKEYISKKNTIHGMRRTRTYMKWCGMIRRCTNKNTDRYERYMGRGITVCDSWRKFENFFNDMGECPAGLTLGRINNDGNYGPDNCRWETKQQQSYNTSRTRRITFRGETKSLEEWCIDIGIPRSTLKQRLGKQGWSVERSLSTPTRFRHANI